MKNPPRPGDFVRTEIIQPAGLARPSTRSRLRIITSDDCFAC